MLHDVPQVPQFEVSIDAFTHVAAPQHVSQEGQAGAQTGPPVELLEAATVDAALLTAEEEAPPAAPVEPPALAAEEPPADDAAAPAPPPPTAAELAEILDVPPEDELKAAEELTPPVPPEEPLDVVAAPPEALADAAVETDAPPIAALESPPRPPLPMLDEWELVLDGPAPPLVSSV